MSNSAHRRDQRIEAVRDSVKRGRLNHEQDLLARLSVLLMYHERMKVPAEWRKFTPL